MSQIIRVLYLLFTVFNLGNKDNYESKFIRTCPVGIKSCFGAKGLYDRDDSKLTNDIGK